MHPEILPRMRSYNILHNSCISLGNSLMKGVFGIDREETKETKESILENDVEEGKDKKKRKRVKKVLKCWDDFDDEGKIREINRYLRLTKKIMTNEQVLNGLEREELIWN